MTGIDEDYPSIAELAAEADVWVMTANDAFNGALVPEAKRALAELANLRRDVANLLTWKAEASAIISAWDEVWEAAGRPGPLGKHKSENVLNHLAGLKRDVVRLTHFLKEAERDLDEERRRRLGRL